MEYEFFGEKLKKLRIERGFTQDDIAKLFRDDSMEKDFSRQAVSKWESGTLPDLEKILSLAVEFNVSLDELLSGEMAYLRRNKHTDMYLNKYPGLVAALKEFMKSLKHINEKED